ncbi:beta-1,4-N-acetylgalactosaminyltransferase bre-4 isoform X2 [Acyrthosiphon pisum]|uniref:Beta-1,4-N-acetylgalactosaminyltransferase n=1 Tax=Acyrthosiphon pisum TaxID=7029 RepID=A0A8R2NQD3_ACYPI|nr:beta-1,4-N-acetylgalactosaminyltransferase bre-4 isoform X2 [Acyrthosiphon pisum]|eukprot:XP_008183480.1 PREDICTED: beta-1,4-N-acetylgalactosaminyltransferase bre-4 isoform X2 [Acyrthosiphon pisum]
MYILTLPRVKILFGFGIACLLVQLLFISYYNEIRLFYNNLCNNIVKHDVPSTHPEPKHHPKLSSILDIIDEKIQTNETKVIHLTLCPQIPPVPNENVSVLVPDRDKLEEVAQQLSCLRLLEGGHQKPLDCQARYKIAIIVPYRNRLSNLCTLLLNLHPFLTKQQLDYTIFVVEQFNKTLIVQDDGLFNRGMLMNIGFTEALKLYDFDCFFFHDVDLIPLNYKNLYSCPDQPRHMALAVDKRNFRLPYFDYFGGVTAMSQTHFKLINGFSNMFWGWGAEDDDLRHRVIANKLSVTRYPLDVGRYHSCSHHYQTPNPKRLELLDSGWKRQKTDGLNSLKYQLIALKKFQVFTYLLVDLSDNLS